MSETIKKLKETQAHFLEKEKMSSIGVLTAGIAHENNNPVNFISSGIEGKGTGLHIILPVDSSNV